MFQILYLSGALYYSDENYEQQHLWRLYGTLSTAFIRRNVDESEIKQVSRREFVLSLSACVFNSFRYLFQQAWRCVYYHSLGNILN